MDVRDLHAYGRLADLDRLAGALIADVNRIHADGQGLVGLRSVTGAYDVLATDVSLNAAGTGLAAAARNGSFFLTVADDATGTPVTSRIELVFGGAGADPSLESLVADVNAQVEHVTASITADRRLSIVADTGFSFTFGNDGEQAREDTSGILSALGVNAFFKGHDARDIAVHDALLDNPLLLAAASSLHPGDGINAGRIAALDTAGSEVLDGASLLQFQHAMVGDVAVATAAARDRSEAADTVLTSLQAQKEAISGVSLDEEAIALLKYERAFQGASRFVAVVDGLLQDLVSLIR
jgi:flagellar hook-associated protein 1 FlgK